MNRVYLIRHAHAGDRLRWPGPDSERPLSDKGWRQARALARLLAGEQLVAIFSSPSLRCVQTVIPMAEQRSLSVRQEARLLEGHDPADSAAWLRGELTARSIAASSHGDVIPAVLDIVAESGADVPAERRWPKGSTWILEGDAGGWRRARFLDVPHD